MAAIRRFTCSDGSGSVTARVELFPAEHDAGGSEPWEIVDGTGQYATLRGKGTWRSVSVSGNQEDPITLTFQIYWTGVVAFDAVPPTVSVKRVTLKQRSKSAYLVQLRLSASDDNPSNAISYVVTLLGSNGNRHTVYTSKAPEMPGPKTISFTAHAAAGTKSLRAAIAVSDPLGNKRTVTHLLSLHR